MIEVVGRGNVRIRGRKEKHCTFGSLTKRCDGSLLFPNIISFKQAARPGQCHQIRHHYSYLEDGRVGERRSGTVWRIPEDKKERKEVLKAKPGRIMGRLWRIERGERRAGSCFCVLVVSYRNHKIYYPARCDMSAPIIDQSENLGAYRINCISSSIMLTDQY